MGGEGRIMVQRSEFFETGKLNNVDWSGVEKFSSLIFQSSLICAALNREFPIFFFEKKKTNKPGCVKIQTCKLGRFRERVVKLLNVYASWFCISLTQFFALRDFEILIILRAQPLFFIKESVLLKANFVGWKKKTPMNFVWRGATNAIACIKFMRYPD